MQRTIAAILVASLAPAVASVTSYEPPGVAGNGYERLFPLPAKMYFAGCNVAGDTACNGACPPGAAINPGWTFLESVGRVFLHGGGYTAGWTSYAYGLEWVVSRRLLTSHIVHPSGDTCVSRSPISIGASSRRLISGRRHVSS